MPDQLQIRDLAKDWIHAWNNKDIFRLMDHYLDDVEFYSPTVIQRWNKPNGKLIGKEAVRQHFLKGFDQANHFHFELVAVLNGIDSIILMYKKDLKTLAADVIIVNEEGKVKKVMAYYGEGNL